MNYLSTGWWCNWNCLKIFLNSVHGWAMMVVKWPAYPPYTTTIRVPIPLKLNFFRKFVFGKNENKQKETGVGPFFKKTVFMDSSNWIFLSTSLHTSLQSQCQSVSQSDQRPPITYFIRKGKNRGCLVSCLTGLHSTKQENMLFLKNGTTSASFTFIFGLFKQTSI